MAIPALLGKARQIPEECATAWLHKLETDNSERTTIFKDVCLPSDTFIVTDFACVRAQIRHEDIKRLFWGLASCIESKGTWIAAWMCISDKHAQVKVYLMLTLVSVSVMPYHANAQGAAAAGHRPQTTQPRPS